MPRSNAPRGYEAFPHAENGRRTANRGQRDGAPGFQDGTWPDSWPTSGGSQGAPNGQQYPQYDQSASPHGEPAQGYHDPYAQQYDPHADPYAQQNGWSQQADGGYAQHPAGYDQPANGYDPAHNQYAPGDYGDATGYGAADRGVPDYGEQDPYAPRFAPFDPHGAGQGHAHDPYADVHGTTGYGSREALSSLQPRGAPRHDPGYGAPHSFGPAEEPGWNGHPGASQAQYGTASGAGPALRGPSYDDSYARGFSSAEAREPHFDDPSQTFRADPNGTPYPAAQPHYDDNAANYGYAQAYARPGDGRSGPAGFDPNGFELDPGLRHAPASGEETALEADDDYDDDYEEEPRRSTAGRVAMIAGALIGAIAVGGGLAYGYKMFFGPAGPASISETAVVRSPSGPNKVRPVEADGRQFSHTDSKILERLGGGGAGAAAGAVGASGASANTVTPLAARDANGARKVAVIPIGRDGSMGQSSESLQPSSQSSEPDNSGPMSFPGLTVVGPIGGDPRAIRRPPAAPPQTRDAMNPARPASPLVVRPPASNQKPVVIANASPETSFPGAASSLSDNVPGSTAGAGSTRIMNPITGRTITVPAPDRKGVVPVDAQSRVAVSRVAPPATVGATQRAVAKPRALAATASASGYVVVLASIPQSSSSRMDALARFADIQQTYGTVLAGKAPEVKSADLGARGRYHRLMVGPPTSSDAAAKLCADLKGAGYSGCWVTTY